jgi:plasmid stability protein
MTPWGHNKTMADVKVRNLPDWVVNSFRKRAESEGRSLEEELRMLLTEEATRRREKMLSELKAFRDKMRKKYGVLSDSTPGIREDRQARG